MKTPDQQVGEAIVKAMTDAGLLTSKGEKTLGAALTKGTQSASDWKFLYPELLMERAQKQNDSTKTP